MLHWEDRCRVTAPPSQTDGSCSCTAHSFSLSLCLGARTTLLYWSWWGWENGRSPVEIARPRSLRAVSVVSFARLISTATVPCIVIEEWAIFTITIHLDFGIQTFPEDFRISCFSHFHHFPRLGHETNKQRRKLPYQKKKKRGTRD